MNEREFNKRMAERAHNFIEHSTPSHYQLDPEPIDVIKAWKLDFCLGNVIKYIARAGKKEGESRDSDLHKAMNYLRMALEEVSSVPDDGLKSVSELTYQDAITMVTKMSIEMSGKFGRRLTSELFKNVYMCMGGE